MNYLVKKIGLGLMPLLWASTSFAKFNVDTSFFQQDKRILKQEAVDHCVYIAKCLELKYEYTSPTEQTFSCKILDRQNTENTNYTNRKIFFEITNAEELQKIYQICYYDLSNYIKNHFFGQDG